jgi:hypothetical protein
MMQEFKFHVSLNMTPKVTHTGTGVKIGLESLDNTKSTISDIQFCHTTPNSFPHFFVFHTKFQLQKRRSNLNDNMHKSNWRNNFIYASAHWPGVQRDTNNKEVA